MDVLSEEESYWETKEVQKTENNRYLLDFSSQLGPNLVLFCSILEN
jgi:hypothetical protein